MRSRPPLYLLPILLVLAGAAAAAHITDKLVVGIYAEPLAEGQPLQLLFNLATLLPTLAVSVRRLHDTDRSGWWLLLGLIPIIGNLILLWWYIQAGTPGDNEYGPPAIAAG